MYDIITVGAGPAGLTAAIYAKRASKKVLVLEALTYGGQIINTPNIENYPAAPHISGVDFATKLYEQAKELGTEIKFEKVVEIRDLENYKEVITANNIYKAKTVILATGADNRKLGLEKEEKLLGKGVSYCATCDGNFFKDKDVAVVGGGDTALQDAIYLSDMCHKVFIIHRREKFKADNEYIEKLKSIDNIEIIYNSNINKLIAEEKLEGIEIINKDTNEIRILKIDGLFIAVGRVPENENFAKLIDLDEKGYVIAKEDCHTSRDGIFVAGDCREKLVRQLVTAASDGAVAATEAVKYINSLKK